MTKIATRVAPLLAAAALSGCFGTDVERAGIGAAAGALAADALGKDIAAGVLLGAAAGALADDVSGSGYGGY